MAFKSIKNMIQLQKPFTDFQNFFAAPINKWLGIFARNFIWMVIPCMMMTLSSLNSFAGAEEERKYRDLLEVWGRSEAPSKTQVKNSIGAYLLDECFAEDRHRGFSSPDTIFQKIEGYKTRYALFITPSLYKDREKNPPETYIQLSMDAITFILPKDNSVEENAAYLQSGHSFFYRKNPSGKDAFDSTNIDYENRYFYDSCANDFLRSREGICIHKRSNNVWIPTQMKDASLFSWNSSTESLQVRMSADDSLIVKINGENGTMICRKAFPYVSKNSMIKFAAERADFVSRSFGSPKTPVSREMYDQIFEASDEGTKKIKGLN